MTRRRKRTIQQLSRQLTFGKLTLGGGRRSQRLKRYQAESKRAAAPARPWDPSHLTGWLRSRFALLTAFLVTACLLYVLFGTSWFYIYDIEVKGARLLTKAEIYNRSNLEALSFFWINPRAVAKRLEEDPLVARAVVSALPPNRVWVQVQERIPVAVWQSAGQSFYVDSEGTLFGLRGDATEMLVIRDLGDNPVLAGTTVDPEAVRSAAELIQLLPERRAYDWEAGLGLSFVTDGGWQVTFGDHTRIAAKVAAYHAFQEQIQSDQKIVLLDLSVPEHPYYRVGE